MCKVALYVQAVVILNLGDVELYTKEGMKQEMIWTCFHIHWYIIFKKWTYVLAKHFKVQLPLHDDKSESVELYQQGKLGPGKICLGELFSIL